MVATSLQASKIVQVALALTAAEGISHRQFAKRIGRDPSEWANVRSGARAPSTGVIRGVRAYAVKVGGVWPSRVDMAIQEDALAEVAV